MYIYLFWKYFLYFIILLINIIYLNSFLFMYLIELKTVILKKWYFVYYFKNILDIIIFIILLIYTLTFIHTIYTIYTILKKIIYTPVESGCARDYSLVISARAKRRKFSWRIHMTR